MSDEGFEPPLSLGEPELKSGVFDRSTNLTCGGGIADVKPCRTPHLLVCFCSCYTMDQSEGAYTQQAVQTDEDVAMGEFIDALKQVKLETRMKRKSTRNTTTIPPPPPPPSSPTQTNNVGDVIQNSSVGYDTVE